MEHLLGRSGEPDSNATFRALVSALVPSTPQLVAVWGQEQRYGAKELGVANYVIWILDHLIALQMGMNQTSIPLSDATAIMLDEAARHLVETTHATIPNASKGLTRGLFASLSRRNRLMAMTLLEQKSVDFTLLPSPFTNNAGFVEFIVQMLNMWTLFGYYSEWSGYGTTAAETPEMRKLEFFPVGWSQMKYPGPALGYRKYQKSLLDISQVKRGKRHE